jgi:hypothetical protein
MQSCVATLARVLLWPTDDAPHDQHLTTTHTAIDTTQHDEQATDMIHACSALTWSRPSAAGEQPEGLSSAGGGDDRLGLLLLCDNRLLLGRQLDQPRRRQLSQKIKIIFYL